MSLLKKCGAGVSLLLSIAASSAAQAAPDGWTMHLAWSPDYCAANLGSLEPQCTEEHYFSVDGLIPQFTGSNPDCTSDKLSDDESSRWLAVIPNKAQVKKVWKRQGACSGLNSADYYTQLERGTRRLLIPEEFKGVTEEQHTTRAAIKAAFIKGSPGLTEEAIVLDCHGSTLRGVNVCFDGDFQFRGCTVADSCRADDVRITPIKSNRVGREPIYR
jgi:ribonuclease T2